MKKKPSIIFGTHPVKEAVKAGKTFEKVIVRKDHTHSAISELLGQLRSMGVPIQYVPSEKLNKITGKNHQGVIAFISEIEYYNIPDIIASLFEQGKMPLILALDGITDVRNFGAIARTAECAGIDAIVIPVKGSVSVNADAIKTSSGALHKVPVCRTNDLCKSLHYLHNSGLQLIGVTEKADEHYLQPNYTLPTVLIMGAEDKGISLNILKIVDKLVKIPLLGSISSLNVSVAASIVMYETVRQRNFLHPEL